MLAQNILRAGRAGLLKPYLETLDLAAALLLGSSRFVIEHGVLLVSQSIPPQERRRLAQLFLKPLTLAREKFLLRPYSGENALELRAPCHRGKQLPLRGTVSLVLALHFFAHGRCTLRDFKLLACKPQQLALKPVFFLLKLFRAAAVHKPRDFLQKFPRERHYVRQSRALRERKHLLAELAGFFCRYAAALAGKSRMRGNLALYSPKLATQFLACGACGAAARLQLYKLSALHILLFIERFS